jgi:hypothetical protein
MMPNQPTLWNRFVAHMTGEVSADTLEAYRRASLAVYEALEHVQTHRQAAKDAGKNAWTLQTSTQAEMLCTWNAFVLQSLGDAILQADYEGDPSTIGFVPPVTADQILRFYTQVEGWLSRAGQAHSNPDYKLDVQAPALLPPWSEVEPCPNAHLKGMLEAMKAVRDHTEAALLFLNESPPQGGDQEKQLNIIRALQSSAMLKARYADDMMGQNPTRDVHERVEEHVKDAIEGFYLLGQLLAMPSLATKAAQPKPALTTPAATPPAPGLGAPAMGGVPGGISGGFGIPPAPYAPPVTTPISQFYPAIPGAFTSPQRLPLPNEAGFDMWCLSDPDALQKLKSDNQARRSLKTLWQLDPEPARTLEIQAQINEAFRRGDISYATDRFGAKLGHFFCAPWAPVYIVKRPLTLGGRQLHTMQQFIFNVTCEGVNLGAPFEREIMTGSFNPTSKFDYGDPNEEPDH